MEDNPNFKTINTKFMTDRSQKEKPSGPESLGFEENIISEFSVPKNIFAFEIIPGVMKDFSSEINISVKFYEHNKKKFVSVFSREENGDGVTKMVTTVLTMNDKVSDTNKIGERLSGEGAFQPIVKACKSPAEYKVAANKLSKSVSAFIAESVYRPSGKTE